MTQWYLVTGRALAPDPGGDQPSPDRDAEVAMGPALTEAESSALAHQYPACG